MTPVVVNVTDSALLGSITGVRTDAAQRPRLVGWTCQANTAQALNYQLYIDAPPSLNGMPIASGTANVGTELGNATVQGLCGTPNAPHHFVIDLSTFAVQYPGRALYVEAAGVNGTKIVLPCEDNSCTMPGTLRIGLTTPANGDRFKDQAFMRTVVSGYNGALDEVAFNVDGTWIPAVPESTGACAPACLRASTPGSH